MRSLVIASWGALALAGCSSSKPAPDSGGGSSSSSPPPAETRHAGEVMRASDASCGTRLEDWCPAPPGDPCGKYVNEAACRSDELCVGMPYRGESVIPCSPDGKGFWSNCPAVGCVARALEK